MTSVPVELENCTSRDEKYAIVQQSSRKERRVWRQERGGGGVCAMPWATHSHLILGPCCCIHTWTRLQPEAGCHHHSKCGTCLLGCSQISCFQSFRNSRMTSEFRWLNLLWGAIFALGPTSWLSWAGLTSMPRVASCKHSIPGSQWTFFLMLMQLPQSQRFPHACYLIFRHRRCLQVAAAGQRHWAGGVPVHWSAHAECPTPEDLQESLISQRQVKKGCVRYGPWKLESSREEETHL